MLGEIVFARPKAGGGDIPDGDCVIRPIRAPPDVGVRTTFSAPALLGVVEASMFAIQAAEATKTTSNVQQSNCKAREEAKRV